MKFVDTVSLVPNSGYMRKRSSSRDVNQIAADIVAAVAEGTELKTEDGKNPFAVALGRRGGLKGGKARAASLTSEQRSQIARRAAASRWGKRGGVAREGTGHPRAGRDWCAVGSGLIWMGSTSSTWRH